MISSKAISYSKLFNKRELCVRTQAFRNINFIVNDLCLFQHNFRWLLSGNCFYFLFFAGKKIVPSDILLMHKVLT